MRRDREVLRFRYDLLTSRTVGRVEKISPQDLPIGTYERDSVFRKPLLDAWLRDRAVPLARASEVLDALGMSSTGELMLSTLGLSLSDQYWLRPPGADVDWHAVNPFENDFDTVLGEALAPEDDRSSSRAIAMIDGDPTVIYSSPDAACGGNLPKYWGIVDGQRRLYKSGKVSNGIMEPYNEAAATVLCSRMLDEGRFVPSRLEDTPFPRVFSSCPCMVDASTELVPAHAVMKLAPHDNSMSLYSRFTATCRDNGIGDVDAELSRMLLVDHVLANRDRHWANFGVIRDVETNEWLGVAPLFDMGESLWCDRLQLPSLRPYRTKHPMPFRREIANQLAALATDLDWYDPALLEGFSEEACSILSQNPYAAATPGFIDLVHEGIERNVTEACAVARSLRPARAIHR